jgi:vacuolar-type H+-ATPase subunit I/STV1
MKLSTKAKRDIVIILLSILVGIILLKTGIVIKLLSHSQNLELLGVFIAGILFTSVFTTVPATIALGELSLITNMPLLIVVGALGALVGDLVMFKFFESAITEDFEEMFSLNPRGRWRKIFRSKIFKIFMTLMGGLIIASPLPDELGLALMGFVKTNNWTFAIISILCNALGIFVIAVVARAIA